MKKLLLVSGLATAAGLLSGLAAAQEVGKVISSTPVVQRMSEPRSVCTDDANGQQRCRTETTTVEHTIGYKVVYEYAGRQYTAQLPSAPGATIELEVTPTVRGALSATGRQPRPTYVSEPQPVYSSQPAYSDQQVYTIEQPVVERVVEPVYVERPYHYAPYYPAYYSPWYPFVGVALGYSIGRYSHSYYGGGHHHVRHWGHGRR